MNPSENEKKNERTSLKLIAVNIVCGPLGVGKTTSINHLLKNRPSDEYWAVLVNEYGLIGLDAALMEPTSEHGAADVEIREVSGGCICCSAGTMFSVSLRLLLQKQPDRLLIEPTGLAALSGILDTLELPGIRELIDVRSIVCLVDTTRLREDLAQDVVADQVEAADVLLANRSDLATTEQLEKFNRWGSGLFPPKKRVGQIERGRIPSDYLDLVTARETKIHRAGHKHGTEHSHGHELSVAAYTSDTESIPGVSNPIIRKAHRSSITSTVGWICFNEVIFDAKKISDWLYEVSNLSETKRVKAVVRTNEGWWAFNLVGNAEDMHPSGYRRDSRFEIIFEGDHYPDEEQLEERLRTCLDHSA